MTCQKYLALSQKLSSIDDEKRGRLISYLPEKSREALTSEDLNKQLIPIRISIQKLVKRVDVSHFIDFFQNVDQNTTQFYIAAFPKYKQVLLTGPNCIYREFSTEKFSEAVLLTLFQQCFKGFPPPAILPFHPMVEILSDQGVELKKLIEFLGLLDVAAEVKTIICAKTLKSLQKAFTKEQVDFINSISKHHKPEMLKKMNLSGYDGNSEELYSLIEQRGIYRFVRSISSVPISYLFLFTYFLPKKLSDKVNRARKQSSNDRSSYNLWEQDCLTTWRFLCTYSQ